MRHQYVLRTWHKLALGAAVGVLALVPASGAGASPASVTPFVIVHDVQTFTASAFCLPEEMIGTVTTQEISTGQSVETASGNFIVRGVDEFSYRIEFPDGSHVEAGIDRDIFLFVANPRGSVFNRVTQDFETIYDVHGTAVGTLGVNAVLHTSWRDADGDGVVDDGELTTQVESFHLRCP
ncbi:hypothetical protein LL946_02975 [Knoellia locipacati]|uniref:hypothetical protein n=1 Tax=Knoellia locipacati TaxID=882824 RepID=UPI00384D49DB